MNSQEANKMENFKSNIRLVMDVVLNWQIIPRDIEEIAVLYCGDVNAVKYVRNHMDVFIQKYYMYTEYSNIHTEMDFREALLFIRDQIFDDETLDDYVKEFRRRLFDKWNAQNEIYTKKMKSQIYNKLLHQMDCHMWDDDDDNGSSTLYLRRTPIKLYDDDY